jgi:outer membrane lipoprotein-sorting protein
MRAREVVAIAILAAGTPPASAYTRPPNALSWDEVAASYERVHDYTALYEKQERAISNGEPQRIKLSFRKPLDVRMEWVNGSGAVDQVAVYRQGQNDGKLIAHRSGMLGSVVGTVRLDVHDKRALEDSRHPITEVGLGHVVAQVSRALQGSRVTSRPPVDDSAGGRPAVRFELDGDADAEVFGVPGARRVSVWVDAGEKLPIKVEIVDAAGTLLERHRFTDLRLNVGLTDATFTL